MANKPELTDSLTALKMYLNKAEPDLKYDIDGSGKVDLQDVLGLQKAYLGKDPGFAFAEDSYFQSPSTKTAADYAAEKQAEQKRVAAEEAENQRLQKLLEDANKYTAKNATGAVTMEEVKANPSMTAEQLANKHVMDYWSGESSIYSQVMKAMNNGTAKLTQIPSGVDQDGNQSYTLGITADPDNPNSNNSLTLRDTGTPNVYQFSTYNQVAGGNIHGLIVGDPKTGRYLPVNNAATMTQYTPGSPGGWARTVIGDIGDSLKQAGPVVALVGNAIMPGAGSALAAALALDESNEAGAVLNALSAGSQMANTAAQNALSAEMSGNYDLAMQESSGIKGALAENAGNLKTATNVAQLANAIDQKNVAGALTAAGTLTGATPSPEIKTGMAVVGLAKALQSGDAATAVALAGQLTGNQDAKVAAQAIKTLNALNSGNPAAAMVEGIKLGKAADPYLKQAKADVLKNANTASTLAEGEIDPSQFDAAELLFGTNAGSLGDASDLAGLQDTGTGSNQMTQEDLVNIVNGGIGDATLTGGTGADTLAGGSLGDASDLEKEQSTGGGSTQLTQEDLVKIVNGGIGDATLSGGTGEDTLGGGQDSAGGGEATTQGGTGADTIVGGSSAGTTLTGDDGSTITIKPDGSVTSTESTLTGGSGAADLITGGTTAQPNVEYYSDGSYKVTYEDGTSALFNADGTPYSTVDNTGTNTLSIIVDDSSPSGYRDSLGQPVNQDGTPYVAPTGNDTLTGGQSTTTGSTQSTVTGGQSTVPGGQSTVPGGQSTVPGGRGLDLASLFTVLGGMGGVQAPQANKPIPVVEESAGFDFSDPLDVNLFGKAAKQKKNQNQIGTTKMASGGSIDDLLELLNGGK